MPSPSRDRDTFAFLLVPGYSMMAFTSALEPLRVANRLAGATLYGWTLMSPNGAPIEASNGIAILPHGAPSRSDVYSAVVVCAGFGAHAFDDRRTLTWLRNLGRRDVMVGAVSTGTWLLAKAGLLQGRRCTIHWEDLEAFAETHPRLNLTGNLYEIDGKRFTCSGGTAALDVMLRLIALRHGDRLAAAVAEQFIHTAPREAGEAQRMTLVRRLRTGHPKLLTAVAMMEGHIQEPLAASRIARQVGFSMRQLERLFKTHLGSSPARHYLRLRLERAHHLLSHTSLSVVDIAIACGFVSAAHFARAFRARFATSPSAVRQLSRERRPI